MLLPGVWKHIVEGHPEIERHQVEIGRALANPKVICRSRKLENHHIYYRRFSKKLFFAVIVDAAKGIVKTSYITDRIKEGMMIWQKKK